MNDLLSFGLKLKQRMQQALTANDEHELHNHQGATALVWFSRTLFA